ncbi:MAG: alcohol dehydrogenase catalytic domain-containing protein [Armatimonadia bacterium]|nr:alcohol dehydrogenase catalytic domain-containing protein [Armatimonadia bacterium]
MQAVVKYGQHDGEVELRDVPEPAPGPGQVLLEVAAAGVCGSDIEMWRHHVTFAVNTPVIQGHEFAGTIAALGEGVDEYQVGDRVVSETAAYICGRCPHCRAGEYNLCPERLGFGYGTNGAFCRYVAVPTRCLHRVPDGVPFEHACLTEPGCVSYNAIIVRSDPRPGEMCVVLGPGPIGLFAVQVARLAGCNPIVLVGTEADAGRLEVGRTVGATHALVSGEDDVGTLVEDLTGGFGAPLVVDAAGGSATLQLSMEIVARNGQITKIGWGPNPVGFSLDPIVQKAARLQGTFSHTWRTWEAVIGLIASGDMMMAPMATHDFSISQWERAYHLVEDREAVKVVLRPE